MTTSRVGRAPWCGKGTVVVANELMVSLLGQYVLWGDERIERTKEWPGQGGVAVTTSQRYFLLELDTRLLIGQAPGMAGVVVATRQDLELEGLPETFGLLVLVGGESVYLNDPAAVAGLGRGLESGLDPVAFAQILVEWHPWTSAVRYVLAERDQLSRATGRSDLPRYEPPMVRPTGTGVELSFFSAEQYPTALGGSRQLDVFEWTVTVPSGGPAQWNRRPVLENVPLEPSRH